MLKVTKQAAAHLLRVRAERGFDQRAGARLVRGTSGVGLTFAPAPETGDEVLSDSDLPIYIAEEVSAVLVHSEIDVAADHNESRLVLRSQAG